MAKPSKPRNNIVEFFRFIYSLLVVGYHVQMSYEDDVYTKLRKSLPEVGEIINKNGVKGKVISLDILNNKYRIETEDKGIVDLNG